MAPWARPDCSNPGPGSFSTTTTRAPRRASASAAVTPQIPAPTTTTSAVCRSLIRYMVLPNMRIKSIEAIPLAASFKQVFRFGMTDRTSSPNALVRLGTDDGVVGWGEACRVQAFTSETQASVVELVETHVGTALVGR